MLSHEVYIHRCELKTSLVERIISASERFSTPSVEPAGIHWILESAGILGRIRFGTSGTTALVHVSMYKYVNMLWFFFSFFVFLQGCENHIFPFIQAEFPRNARSRWRDWSDGKEKGEETSLPVFQASESQIILIKAPPIQHFLEIHERWSGETESNALCQIRATGGQIW